MKIFTCYHSNVRNLNLNVIEPINISISPPKWANYKSYLKLAPTRTMLYMNQEEYDRKFDLILKSLNPQLVYQELKRLTDKENIALICYEKPSDFCHRHVVARWLMSNLPVKVEELDRQKHRFAFLANKKDQLGLF